MLFHIESTKTTSMEDFNTGVLLVLLVNGAAVYKEILFCEKNESCCPGRINATLGISLTEKDYLYKHLDLGSYEHHAYMKLRDEVIYPIISFKDDWVIKPHISLYDEVFIITLIFDKIC